ncbi:Glu/Leu/Phe/Val dehydrogenase [Motiliproteus coralliicola]|uniref:Glutamate dehydrogenase n=1 Tax=Motiliproteus coralliicola TaxID=2283196 RepID=A0A369WFZ7_9GAMM|nr:Glu/Leu/Phe/Val dehydrogenase [Motiliproteus coralliicola]RDE19536.1 Glu/Leu/Phe/Val dehydrogenase [Motiliproteus coralliicola]
MSELFDSMDELGPTRTIHVYEPSLGLRAVLVIDNVAAGPAIGGLRMATDVSTRECARLARAMTLKNAAAGLAHGGAKSVLFGDPRMPVTEKEQLVRAFACALKNESAYIFGPDMGTDENCMAWVKDEIGRAVGLPKTLGGIPLDEIGATAWGLNHAVEVALEHCDFELEGARVAVQGFGAVGSHAARFLCAKGAVLVAVADSQGAVHDPLGLDLAQLLALKSAGKSVIGYPNGLPLESEAMVGIECDIWIPAARPDVIHEGNVDQLQTRLVVQGANIPITPAAEKRLHQRGILNIPDIIANAGGVICAAMEYQHQSQASALDAIEDKVRSNTAETLETALARQITPRAAALKMAKARVMQAMCSRRWSLY